MRKKVKNIMLRYKLKKRLKKWERVYDVNLFGRGPLF